MKSIKMFAGCVLIAFFAINSFGQALDKTATAPTKLDKKQIPKEVSEPYYKEYPISTYENWYGYPTYNIQSDWFDNWYENGPYIRTELPEYYIVEFNKENTPVKAIYTKSGTKIAIHKSLKSDLPNAISVAISKSEYKTWKLGKDKEEIFKDTDKDQLKIYKVDVEKGKEKHTLFFQIDGKLLKDKKVA